MSLLGWLWVPYFGGNYCSIFWGNVCFQFGVPRELASKQASKQGSQAAGQLGSKQASKEASKHGRKDGRKALQYAIARVPWSSSLAGCHGWVACWGAIWGVRCLGALAGCRKVKLEKTFLEKWNNSLTSSPDKFCTGHQWYSNMFKCNVTAAAFEVVSHSLPVVHLSSLRSTICSWPLRNPE